MKDLSEAIEAQKVALEAQLNLLKSTNVTALEQKRREHAEAIDKIDAQLAEIRSRIGFRTGTAPTTKTPVPRGPRKKKRTRMSSAEVKERIDGAVSAAKKGISQKEISESTGVNYATVAKYFKDFARSYLFEKRGTSKVVFPKA